MDGFGLLIGHLLGDYILQNDWMAANKTNPHPGKHPAGNLTMLRIIGADVVEEICQGMAKSVGQTYEPSVNVEIVREWEKKYRCWLAGNLACTVHCLLYTLAVWACSFWWMPWWGLVICFLVHWPVDRFRLARWWMMSVSSQKSFATGVLSPWSIIVVDNTFHLWTLFVIALFAGKY